MDGIKSEKKMAKENYDGYNEFYAVYKSEDDQNYFADDNPLSNKMEERRCEFSGDLGEQMKKSMLNSNLDDEDDYEYDGAETKDTVEIRSQLQKTQDELAMFQLKVASLEEENRLLLISSSVVANNIEPISLNPTRIYLPETHFPSSSGATTDDVFDFVNKGNLESLKNTLLASPNIVFAANSEGRTALHLACMNNLLLIVKLLIQNYADVNAKDAGGQTPLHLCSDPGIVDVLCTRGARTSIRDNHGFTALYVHTLHSRTALIQSLLSHSADPMLEEPKKHRNALHCAADIGDYSVVSSLLLQSTVSLSLDAQDINGDTALHIISRNKKHELESEQGTLQQKCLMLFLDRGSLVNIQNKRGDAPLHLICANRSLRSCMAVAPLVEILLEMSADPNALDHDGCTPLMICSVYGDWEVCRLLIQAGGDLNAPCVITSHYLLNSNDDVRMEDEYQMMESSRNVLSSQTCTPLDIIPSDQQDSLFKAISASQTMDLRGNRCKICRTDLEDVDPYPTKTISHFFKALVGIEHISPAKSLNSSSGSDTTSDSSSCIINNCAHCGRLLCDKCLPRRLLGVLVPKFMEEQKIGRLKISEMDGGDSVKLCLLCYTIIAV